MRGSLLSWCISFHSTLNQYELFRYRLVSFSICGHVYTYSFFKLFVWIGYYSCWWPKRKKVRGSKVERQPVLIPTEAQRCLFLYSNQSINQSIITYILQYRLTIWNTGTISALELPAFILAENTEFSDQTCQSPECVKPDDGEVSFFVSWTAAQSLSMLALA